MISDIILLLVLINHLPEYLIGKTQETATYKSKVRSFFFFLEEKHSELCLQQLNIPCYQVHLQPTLLNR